MLSDEEREALQYFNTETKTEAMHYGAVLVKLIEKQSKEIEEYKKQLDLDNECEIALNSKVMDLEKEIEELKEKNNKLMEELDLTTVYISGVYDGEKKVEDKIKAKIEELENEKEKYFEKQVIQHEIEILHSLLEKE